MARGSVHEYRDVSRAEENTMVSRLKNIAAVTRRIKEFTV